MFLQMLKDEFPEVRLHIISKLELVNQGRQAPSLFPLPTIAMSVIFSRSNTDMFQ